MATSAGSLCKILSVANRHNVTGDRFLKVVADRLDLEGDDREAVALIYIHRLLKRVHDDVDSLDFEESRKNRLKAFLRPFDALLQLSGGHLDIANAKNNYLKSDHLTGLMNVDDALSGIVEYSEFPKEIVDLADKLREVRSEFENSDAPKRVRQVVSRRLNQIASMLENLHVYGAEAIQEELEALIGALVVQPPKEGSSAWKAAKKIGGLATAIFLALPMIDDSLGATKSLSSQAKAFLESTLTERSDSEINPQNQALE